MRKEIEYEKICDKVSSIFFELAETVDAIRDNFQEEHLQDPQLNLEIINRSIKSVTFNAQAFLGYKKRMKTNWSLEKYIEYAKEDLLSFFREFDNPFLGSRKWTVRIKCLLETLSTEYDKLENLSNMIEESPP
jgi:hypothetical protein